MSNGGKIPRAQQTLDTLGILQELKAFDATVVSTIFVGFDTDKSDIDIVCTYQPQQRDDADTSSTAKVLVALLQSVYGDFKDFVCEHYAAEDFVLCQFDHHGFVFEIYASTKPVHQQNGFRHYQVMKRLSRVDPSFGKRVQEIRRKMGLKTEPAICALLQLQACKDEDANNIQKSNPYEAVLLLEDWSDEDLVTRIRQCCTSSCS